ncbi:hypothetical protein BJG92_00801 [Arthrobacter sp. SO5]|nr:hypothetical protein [Arthrobacter sp. SO5]
MNDLATAGSGLKLSTLLQADGLLSEVLPQNRRVGIRYYAYAFDSDQTGKALADPFTVIGSDPYADACGLEPGFPMGVTDFRQSLPERDFLYLDTAWRSLQQLTSPRISGAGARRLHPRIFVDALASDGRGCAYLIG